MDFGTGGVPALRDLVGLPQWPVGTSETDILTLLVEEAQVRDDFTRYAYAYDDLDLEAVLGFFADDCVIVNPRGTVSGAQQIRDNYRTLLGGTNAHRHVWSNVTVRFTDAAATDVYVGAYHHTVVLTDPRTVSGTGTDIRHLRRVDQAWKIVERWITNDVVYTVSLVE
jgi:uncharacterized protein (TIGR02246 family)